MQRKIKPVDNNLVAVLSVEQSDPLVVAITPRSTDGSLWTRKTLLIQSISKNKKLIVRQFTISLGFIGIVIILWEESARLEQWCRKRTCCSLSYWHLRPVSRLVSPLSVYTLWRARSRVCDSSNRTSSGAGRYKNRKWEETSLKHAN